MKFMLNESIKILYEDKNLLAIDKPEGIASISESNVLKETVHSILEKKYSQKLFIVHRLDKDVSGIILFAKNSKTHKFLNKQFEYRLIKKNYIALVHGIIKENNGLIDEPIREFGSGRMGVDKVKGKVSLTKFKVLERFHSYTLLELNPQTGRRHQLRVHLYHIGHPIVGDIRYGDKAMQKEYSRLMLHANKIELFIEEKKNLIIKSDLPETFNQILEEIKSIG